MTLNFHHNSNFYKAGPISIYRLSINNNAVEKLSLGQAVPSATQAISLQANKTLQAQPRVSVCHIVKNPIMFFKLKDHKNTVF